ncbi:hypothetical protein ZOSMA_92G00330 [Zostera marina]|uniref:Uncharacterized protein n=1 Tax=Zostera marina TaxID=29655 RepID=A0A0K9NKT0_ZOSMR|nr:hypothetical protein ZOSMA_92G00330 [Zostera marina]
MAMEPQEISNGDSAAVPSEPTRLEASMGSVTAKIASARLIRLTESMKLEHQLMRVPLEHLKKTMRANHRSIEKEVSVVLSTVKELSKESVDSSTSDAVQKLNSLVSRLQGLKRKLEEGNLTESLQVQRFKRILVDYLLRLSCYDTATKLAETSNIQELVDIDVFLDAKNVIDGLKNKQVGPALTWCLENRSRLKKTKANLCKSTGAICEVA